MKGPNISSHLRDDEFTATDLYSYLGAVSSTKLAQNEYKRLVVGDQIWLLDFVKR